MDRAGAIRARLDAALAPEALVITDESRLHAGHPGAAGGGGHFTVDIVAAGFRGHNLLERHRMVYAALGDLMPAEIHALSIRAKAPEEQ